MGEIYDFKARAATLRQDAEKWRLVQASTLLKLFEREHGRPASTTQELMGWVAASNIARPIDPAAVLSEEELQDVIRSVEDE